MAAVTVKIANTHAVFSVSLHSPKHCRHDLSKPGVRERGKKGYFKCQKRRGATKLGLQL